ncbi:hypothetical protein D3C71_1410210 [compost metagenome]
MTNARSQKSLHGRRKLVSIGSFSHGLAQRPHWGRLCSCFTIRAFYAEASTVGADTVKENVRVALHCEFRPGHSLKRVAARCWNGHTSLFVEVDMA